MDRLFRQKKQPSLGQKPKTNDIEDYYKLVKGKILESVQSGNFTSFDGEHTLTESLEDWYINNRNSYEILSFMKQLLLTAGYDPVGGEFSEKSEFRDKVLFIVRSERKGLRELENAYTNLLDPNYFNDTKTSSPTGQNNDPDAMFRRPAEETQEHNAVNPE